VAAAVHEASGQHRKGRYVEECDWHGAAKWLIEKDNRALCGFPYGLMVHYLRHRVLDLRVICVRRDKETWLQSVGKAAVDKSMSWPRNIQSKEHYWQIYENLMLSVTPPVLHLTMGDLDDCKPRVEAFISETQPDVS